VSLGTVYTIVATFFKELCHSEPRSGEEPAVLSPRAEKQVPRRSLRASRGCERSE
jgi:hypothetical protein